MRSLRSSVPMLVVCSVLTLLLLSAVPLGWAQSGSPAPPPSEPQAEETAVQTAPPSSEADVAPDATSANGTATEPVGGTSSAEKEFNPSEEIVEDQAVSFPVDI